MLFARQHQEMAKVREVLMIQDLLQRLKVDTIRLDFLNQRNGACPINKAEMEFIEKFAQQVVPVRPNFSNEPSFASGAKASAEVFSFLIDERHREFQDTGYTFEKGKELFNRIQSCGYWEKDMKFVAEESREVNDSPDTDYLEGKEEHSEETGVKILAAPAPTQVPTPTFNGNINNTMPVQQQMQQMHLQKNRNTQQQATALSTIPANAQNMKTTVTAVENAYFNQIKYSHTQPSTGQVMNNNNTMPIPATNQNDFGTNFSFLQDSELDSPAGAHGSQQQHKMPVNVIQPKHQQQVPQQFNNANFHPQSPIAAAATVAAGQAYPPGLKVQQMQNTVSHIPGNYQASPQQLNQQSAVPKTQVPSHMIPKQQQPSSSINGNQIPGYGTQTPPTTQRPAASAAYPTMVPSAQYQVQPVDPKNDEKEKQREEYQEQPQIDTWTNETAAQTGGNGSYSTRSSGGGYNRNTNRSSTTAGGAKFNNYR
jgi:hypothetical protein